MSPSVLGTAAERARPRRAVEEQPLQCPASGSCGQDPAQVGRISHLPHQQAGNAFALQLLEAQPAESTQLMHSSPNKRAEHDLFDKDLDHFNQEPRAKIWQENFEMEH